jgi:hypothetical protein
VEFKDDEKDKYGADEDVRGDVEEVVATALKGARAATESDLCSDVILWSCIEFERAAAKSASSSPSPSPM